MAKLSPVEDHWFRGMAVFVVRSIVFTELYINQDLFAGCVTLGKSLDLSEPHFPHL
jgi:hypothetical protein